MNHTVKDRFLKYVQIDTQADPFSDTVPSTVKQLNLCRELSKELDAMGIAHELSNLSLIHISEPTRPY